MSNNLPITCQNCGLVLSTGGGRCPHCGADQPELSPQQQRRGAIVGTPLRRPPARKRSGLATALPASIAVVAVAVAGLLAWQFWLKRRAPEPSAPKPAASAAERKPILDAGTYNPSTILVKSKVRALAWHADAVLVSAEFSPVVGGKVDIKGGGRYEVVFGKPAGKKLGPGARVGAKRLVVIVDAKGTRTEERSVTDPARGIPDPDCPFDEAWRNLVAAGVPSNARLTVRYAMSKKHDRAVWNAEVDQKPELGRTLDGRACTILRR